MVAADVNVQHIPGLHRHEFLHVEIGLAVFDLSELDINLSVRRKHDRTVGKRVRRDRNEHHSLQRRVEDRTARGKRVGG